MKTHHLPKFLKKIPTSMAVITLLAFGVLAMAGILDCANPMMRNQMAMAGTHEPMVDCIPGQTCGMDLSTHIRIWQGMVTTNLTAFSFFAALLVIGFLLVRSTVVFIPEIVSAISRYQRQHYESKLYNYFTFMFARGILQPKLYAC